MLKWATERLPFFRWYTLVKFCFFILVYRRTDPSGRPTRSVRSFYFLMVIYLFTKKAVPLYRNQETLTTHDGS